MENSEKIYTFDDLSFESNAQGDSVACMTFENGVEIQIEEVMDGKYLFKALSPQGLELTSEPNDGRKKYMNVLVHAAQLLDPDDYYRLKGRDKYAHYYHGFVPTEDKMDPKLREVCDKVKGKDTAHYTVEEVHLAMQLYHNNGGGAPKGIWLDNKDSDEKSSANKKKRILETKRLRHRLMKTIAAENISDEIDPKTGKRKINPKYTPEDKKAIADVLTSMAKDITD